MVEGNDSPTDIVKGAEMNMNRVRLFVPEGAKVLLQEGETTTVVDTTPDNTEDKAEDKKEGPVTVKTTDFGEIRRDTFSISVTGDEVDKETGKKKVVYENKAEPFEYDFVVGLPNVFKHLGAKLDENQEEFLATALKSEDAEVDKTIGKATSDLVKLYNAKVKADAKSSAYQSLVNKHKPLEGEKMETARARLVSMFMRMGGISADTAIEELKGLKKLPEDYTVADFNATPLRRTKGDDDE